MGGVDELESGGSKLKEKGRGEGKEERSSPSGFVRPSANVRLVDRYILGTGMGGKLGDERCG